MASTSVGCCEGPRNADAAPEKASVEQAVVEMPEQTVDEAVDPLDEEDENDLSCLGRLLYGFFALCFLYGFLFGLGLMGDAFKVLGGKAAGGLFTGISNPIAGLMVGIIATVLVQSSSTSTSVVVGMVGAGILPVQTAIPVIMGCNIGTSVTNTIVSMGQMGDPVQYKRAFAGATIHDCFNLFCVLIFLPLEIISKFLYYWSEWLTSGLDGAEGGTFKSPIKIIVSPLVKVFISVDKKKINKIADGSLTADKAGSLIKSGAMSSMDDGVAGALALVVSLIILCICLYGIVSVLRRLVMGKAKKCIKSSLAFTDTWWGGYVAILVGAGATVSVQSSSITTSTLTPLVGVGVITLDQMLPLTLGANIGTTCTGLLAAMVSAKRHGLQIALVHLSFNIFGVLLFYPIPMIRHIPRRMASWLGIFAWHYRWFPLFYILLVFALIPAGLIGISRLFEAGPIGVAFGIFTLVIIVAAIGYVIFLYVYRGGKEFLNKLGLESGTDMNDPSASVTDDPISPKDTAIHLDVVDKESDMDMKDPKASVTDDPTSLKAAQATTTNGAAIQLDVVDGTAKACQDTL